MVIGCLPCPALPFLPIEQVVLACMPGLVQGRSVHTRKTLPKDRLGKPHPLTPKALRASEDTLDRTLKERKGPWTEARAKALALDDRARVLQDKGRLFKDRAALASGLRENPYDEGGAGGERAKPLNLNPTH